MITPVESALGRILQAYSLMFDDKKTAEARPKLERYLRTLESTGETDADRLAVCGLAFLRKGYQDPAKQGFSGL